MRNGSLPRVAVVGLGLLATACQAPSPPTVTPGPAPTAVLLAPGAPGTAGTSIEIPVPTPIEPMVPLVTPEPITLGDLMPYVDPAGRYTVAVPGGWSPAEQNVSGNSDVKMGVVFQSPEGNGLLTVTQFDNGKTPVSFGATVNGIMKMTGLTERPGFQEVSREQVMDRRDSAMRVEILYRRNNGVPMHSLLLFQLDGTVFSMVHAGVESGSWQANEPVIREILRSYRAGVTPPAAPTPAP